MQSVTLGPTSRFRINNLNVCVKYIMYYNWFFVYMQVLTYIPYHVSIPQIYFDHSE